MVEPAGVVKFSAGWGEGKLRWVKWVSLIGKSFGQTRWGDIALRLPPAATAMLPQGATCAGDMHRASPPRMLAASSPTVCPGS